MDLRDYVKIGLEFEKRELEFYEKAIAKKVDGELRIKNKGEKREIYIKRNDRLEYVNKEKIQEAARIVYYKRKVATVEILRKSINAREKLIAEYVPLNKDTLDQIMEKEYSREILDALSVRDEKVRIRDKRMEMCKKPSENKYETQGLVHQTKFGLNVRSRIEVMIAEALFDAGVSFRYEEELKLSDEMGQKQSRYPDFTIHCADGKKIYWEHAGMLDNPEYEARHNEKMHMFYINNIFEPNNLIVTMENASHELDMESIWRVINGMILPVI